VKNVVIHTKSYCPYCHQAVALLKKRGIPFTENVLDPYDSAAMNELTKRSGMRTVPQIFADDELIGGYDELAALDRKDNLESIKKG